VKDSKSFKPLTCGYYKDKYYVYHQESLDAIDFKIVSQYPNSFKVYGDSSGRCDYAHDGKNYYIDGKKIDEEKFFNTRKSNDVL